MSEKEKKHKHAFTIRLEKSSIDDLERVSKELHISKASVARNFIQLSRFFIAESNYEVKSFNKINFSVIPKEILRIILEKLDENIQFEIGDRLGSIINNNSQILGYNNLDQKRGLIQGLNWMKFTPVQDITKELDKSKKDGEKKSDLNVRYWGIPRETWPLATIHALLYRIKHNQKYNPIWNELFLKKYLDKSEKELKGFLKVPKKHPILVKDKDFIQKFKNGIGGRIENFNSENNYYIFDVLRIKE